MNSFNEIKVQIHSGNLFTQKTSTSGCIYAFDLSNYYLFLTLLPASLLPILLLLSVNKIFVALLLASFVDNLLLHWFF